MAANLLDDLKNNLLEQTGLISASIGSGETDGTGIDTTDYVPRQLSLLVTGVNIQGTTPTLDVKVQESADNSTNWTDVTGASVTQITTTTSVQRINFQATKRYVRVAATVGGTSTPQYAISAVFAAQRRRTGVATAAASGGYSNAPQS